MSLLLLFPQGTSVVVVPAQENGSVYGGGAFDDIYALREKRKKEDDLVIDFIKTIVTKGLI